MAALPLGPAYLICDEKLTSLTKRMKRHALRPDVRDEQQRWGRARTPELRLNVCVVGERQEGQVMRLGK